MYRSITKFRGAMVSIIYEKSLEIQADLYNESKAITLMSTDIDRLAQSLAALCQIWASVIEMAIGLWLLERQIGWVCVAPILVTLSKVLSPNMHNFLLNFPRSKLFLWGSNSEVHRNKATRLGPSYPTTCGHDGFDAGFHEEREDDGSGQNPCGYNPRPENPRAQPSKEVSCIDVMASAFV